MQELNVNPLYKFCYEFFKEKKDVLEAYKKWCSRKYFSFRIKKGQSTNKRSSSHYKLRKKLIYFFFALISSHEAKRGGAHASRIKNGQFGLLSRERALDVLSRRPRLRLPLGGIAYGYGMHPIRPCKPAPGGDGQCTCTPVSPLSNHFVGQNSPILLGIVWERADDAPAVSARCGC